MAFLTDRTLATGVTVNDLIHIVVTGDTSQNPAGSSFKATLGQFVNILPTFTGGSGNCITELYVENIFACNTGVTIHSDFTPVIDNTINLGTSIKRFRDINTVSGTTTVWSATTKIYTPELDLGLDGLGNSRVITANNSIIQDDTLNGGAF